MSFSRCARAGAGMPIRSLAVLGLAATLCPSVAAAQHFPSDDQLAVMLRYLVEDAAVPGVVLAVREPDGSTRIVSDGSGGEGTLPLGSISLFEIGSITKTFTGTLLADMALRGEVDLDDPVSTYLPDHIDVPSRAGQQITLLHLATHRSGLPLWGRHFDPPDPDDPWAGYTVEAMYDYLSSYELERVPGADYHYSNFGFGLLGHALARVAGMTYPELVEARILQPLGMEMTGYEVPDSLAEWMTLGQEANATVAVESDARRGAGGLISTADDLLQWLEVAIRPPDDVVGRAVAMAREPRLFRDDRRRAIGLGWWTDTLSANPVVSHGGRRAGYMANLALDPTKGVGSVMLWNTERHQDALGTVLVTMAPPPAAWSVSGEGGARVTALEEFAGSYERENGAWAFIGVDDGHLTYQPPGRVRARLYPKPDSTFYMLRGPWTVAFDRDASGAVTGMRMTVDEREPTSDVALTFMKVNDETLSPRAIYSRDFEEARGEASALPWILGVVVLAGLGGAYLVARR